LSITILVWRLIIGGVANMMMLYGSINVQALGSCHAARRGGGAGDRTSQDLESSGHCLSASNTSPTPDIGRPAQQAFC